MLLEMEECSWRDSWTEGPTESSNYRPGKLGADKTENSDIAQCYHLGVQRIPVLVLSTHCTRTSCQSLSSNLLGSENTGDCGCVPKMFKDRTPMSKTTGLSNLPKYWGVYLVKYQKEKIHKYLLSLKSFKCDCHRPWPIRYNLLTALLQYRRIFS